MTRYRFLTQFDLAGNNPADGVPLGWLDAFRQEAIAKCRAVNGAVETAADAARVQREVDSIRVFGAHHLTAGYIDEQTEVEELREAVLKAEELRHALRGLRHADGTLVHNVDQKLKELGL